MSTRFDSDIAEDVSTMTYAPRSDSGRRPPRVRFAVLEDGASMTAAPPGARIDCEIENDQHAQVRIVDMRTGKWEHIANVQVRAPDGCDITTEAITIASAIYWSWWRARDMQGEAPHVQDR